MPSPCDASQGGSGRQQPTEVGAAQRDVLVAHRPSTKPEGGSHSRRTAAASFPRPFLACPVGRGALAKTGEAAWRRGARWLPTLADHGARPSPSRDCPASRPARSPTPPTPKRGEAVGRYRVAVPLPDPIRRGVRPLARPCCRTRPSCSPPPRVGAVARHGGPSLRLPSSGPGPGRRSGRSPSSALHCSGGQRFAAVVRSPWRRRSPCPHRSRWWVVGAPWSVLMSPGLPKGRRGDRSRALSACPVLPSLPASNSTLRGVSPDPVVLNLTLLGTLSRSFLLSLTILAATLAGFVPSGNARPDVAPRYALPCLV
jgi:hypothetical protein